MNFKLNAGLTRFRAVSEHDTQMTNPRSVLAQPQHDSTASCPSDCQRLGTNYLAAAKELAPNTVAQYRLETVKWLQWCRENHVTSVPEAAEKWRAYWHWRKKTSTPISWGFKAAQQRKMWAYAVETGLVAVSPVNPGSLPKLSKRREAPAEKDVERMLQPDFPVTPKSLRNQVLLVLLTTTGARISEIASLTRANLHLKEREAFVTVKGGAMGKIYLTIEAVAVINAWLIEGRPKWERKDSPDNVLLSERGGSLTRCTACKAIGQRARHRGVKMTAHQLRHRFATRLLESGATLPEVSKLLNHRALSSTLVYLHTTDQQARSAHARLNAGANTPVPRAGGLAAGAAALPPRPEGRGRQKALGAGAAKTNPKAPLNVGALEDGIEEWL
jgi:integrase/recombinase XerD